VHKTMLPITSMEKKEIKDYFYHKNNIIRKEK